VIQWLYTYVRNRIWFFLQRFWYLQISVTVSHIFVTFYEATMWHELYNFKYVKMFTVIVGTVLRVDRMGKKIRMKFYELSSSLWNPSSHKLWNVNDRRSSTENTERSAFPICGSGIRPWTFWRDKKPNKWPNNFDKRPHSMSRRYWGLNYLFFCCAHRKLPLYCGGLDSHLTHGF